MEGKKLKYLKTIALFLASALVLSACGNISLKEESKAASKTVKQAFTEKVKRTNKNSGKIHFYLPFGYEIIEKSPNNTILKNGSKTYILFHNPQENASSEVVYKASEAQYKKLDADETFTNDNKLGFMLIKHLDHDMNELIVGVGGTKLTTQTKTSSLKNEAKDMMEIVQSVTYEK